MCVEFKKGRYEYVWKKKVLNIKKKCTNISQQQYKNKKEELNTFVLNIKEEL